MDRRTRLYIVLTAIFLTSLVVADIIGSKFVLIGDLTLPVGLIPFPVTFLLTDLINEYYGKKATRRVTWLGLAMAAYAFGIVLLGRVLPTAPRSPLPGDVFEQVFGASNRLYVASLTAYVVGQLTDIWAFGFLKRLTRGRFLWARATGSTLVSQGLDSFAVATLQLSGTTLADGTTADLAYIVQIATTGYVLKFFLALGLTPVIYLGHGVMQSVFGLAPLAPDDADA